MSELIESPSFKDMPIGKLREYASHMRVPLAKTATKPEIIEALERKANGRAVPELADSSTKLKPGYARIRVLEDPTPGAANIPPYINENGYEATVPRGKDIVVPMKVVRNLTNAVVSKRRQQLTMDDSGVEKFKESTVQVPSYPFQVLEMNPGPEVLTAYEKAKQKIQGPRNRYRALFGRWPSPRELARAIEQGLIKLQDEEQLSPSVDAIIGTDHTKE